MGAENDAEFALVTRGLSDSVTNDLSNLEAAQQSLWVVPASSVRRFEVVDATSAFHQLGATVVVECHISRSGPAVYLTVNLIDAKHLRQIGSARFADRSGDLNALETQTVRFVAQAMRVKVSGEVLRTATNVPPSSWESYLKALGLLQRFDKPHNIDLAISAVLSAVQSDPGFALGYATLGDAYRLKYQTERDPRWLDQAAANCHKALQIDPQLASARVTLARLDVIGGKNDLALLEFNKALEIDPRNAEALYGTGEIYESLGRAADAEATYQRAIALRPDYWGGYNYLAAFYDGQNRPQEAIATFRRVTQMTPDSPIAYSNLGAAYMVLRDSASQAEAQAAFEKSLQLAPTYQAYSNLGYLYLIAGRYAEAAEKLRKAVELNDQDWRVLANLIEAYNWLKDTDKSRPIRDKYLRLLEQSAAAAPGDGNAQASLGIFYSEFGQRQRALECAKSALTSAPKDGFVLAGVAQVYENLGDRKRAVQFALDSVANGASLQELQHRLGLQGVLSDPSFRTSSTNRSNGK